MGHLHESFVIEHSASFVIEDSANEDEVARDRKWRGVQLLSLHQAPSCLQPVSVQISLVMPGGLGFWKPALALWSALDQCCPKFPLSDSWRMEEGKPLGREGVLVTLSIKT